MKNDTAFRAPQKTLRTSWVQMAYSKPKSTGAIVKRSLSSRAKPIFKSKGQITTLSFDNSY